MELYTSSLNRIFNSWESTQNCFCFSEVTAVNSTKNLPYYDLFTWDSLIQFDFSGLVQNPLNGWKVNVTFNLQNKLIFTCDSCATGH